MISGAESELLLYGLLIGLFAGALGGTLAGLAGVGGGLVYVPLFYALLPAQQGQGMALHIFASFVAIIITGFFSARSHWRLGHIDRQTLSQLLPGLIIGAIIGLWSTLRLPEAAVLLGLAALDAWIAFDYGRTIPPDADRRPSLRLFSGPIGLASGALGIGGGTMLVPLLRRHLILRHAVGTSAACGFVMALTAVTANLLAEPDWHELMISQWPQLLGIWLGIALILPRCSHWSARLHQVSGEQNLRLALKILFFLLSACLLLAATIALLHT
ncbi:sulfite exporter TauE/SafE family protein [Mariprofundus erugo]|uniref:Probable membrane transporter protein n=1 Tax=Mariprofundus erugo TaxID=2528639 RepID=A0A5R9GUE4_9PROT|nr:sulfite exporter TauE/SafE family protein [Mariprofundus erugo]TLS68625.1 sulfite exporter TauE/SafE family protein [Mariprofundus erugo]